MNVYLAIITTVLVVTQVIRVTQNAIQLRRQVKQLSHLEDVTNEDLRTQKKAYTLIVDYLEKRVTDEIEWGGDDDAG